MYRKVLTLPLRIPVSKKKDFLINLNNYRNAHFLVLNKVKQLFKEAIQNQLDPLPIFEWVRFRYTLYPGSNHLLDTNNICAVADKFFADALVEAGKLEDDNYLFLKGTSFRTAHVDKTNPRIEVTIWGKLKEAEQMKFNVELDNDDFHKALEEYVYKHASVPSGTHPEFQITAGRGDKGYSAVVTFVTNTEVVEPEKPKKRTPVTSTEAVAESLKEQGNVMNRLDKEEVPAPAPKPVANPFASKESTSLVDEVMEDKDPDLVEETAKEAPKPLFSFPSKN